jgi:dTDP-glucose 4,6-dehydratase
MPVVLSNCSNNYGSHHFPEKLIPLAINNIKHNRPIPIYGKGENIRDWLFVDDHARAIDVIFHTGKDGDTYNIGGNNEWTNIDLIRLLCSIMDRKLGRAEGESAKLITYVTDRAGHDLRYAIDSSKLQRELGWKPSLQFEEGLEKTVDWYLANEAWVDRITSGAYQQYYEKQYTNR